MLIADTARADGQILTWGTSARTRMTPPGSGAAGFIISAQWPFATTPHCTLRPAIPGGKRLPAVRANWKLRHGYRPPPETALRQAAARRSRRPLRPTMTVEPSWPRTPSGSGRCPARSHVTRAVMMTAAMARFAAEDLRGAAAAHAAVDAPGGVVLPLVPSAGGEACHGSVAGAVTRSKRDRTFYASADALGGGVPPGAQRGGDHVDGGDRGRDARARRGQDADREGTWAIRSWSPRAGARWSTRSWRPPSWPG